MLNGRFSFPGEDTSNPLSPRLVYAAVQFAAAGVIYHFERPFLSRLNRVEGASLSLTGSVGIPVGSRYSNPYPYFPLS